MKKVSLILIFAIIFSSLVPLSVFADESDNTITDSDAEYAEKFLSAFGFDTSGYTSYDDKVSRITFLRAVAHALNITGGTPASFVDLTDTDAEIAGTAVKLEIINDAERFNPDREVTYAEGYKMAVVAAGYALEAMQSGGYPTGYMITAQKIGIADFVSQNETSSLSYGDFFKLIRNMCETDIKYIASLGTNMDFSVTEGINMLTYYHGLKQSSGKIEATEHTSLYNPDIVTGKGRIKIGRSEYYYDGKCHIGANVSFYYKDKGTIEEIIYLDEQDNKFFTVDAENINYTESGALGYTDTLGKKKKMSIHPSPAIIYNGKASVTRFPSFEDIDIRSGSITLMDSGVTGEYDVVFVDEYVNMYISKVNPQGTAIYDMNDASRAINIDNESSVNIYSENNQQISLSEIGTKTAAIAYKSEDGKLAQIYISTKTVMGKIDELNTVNKEIIVDDKTYKYTDYFESFYLNSAIGYDSLTFKLNSNDEIVAYDSPDGETLYGIILASSVDSGLSPVSRLKIFSSKGSLDIYELASKISVDNQAKENAKDAVTKYFSSVGTDIESFIGFTLNASGQISKIDTLYTQAEREGNAPSYSKGNLSGMENPDDRLKAYNIDYAGKKAYFKMNTIHPFVGLSSETKVFSFDTDTSVNEQYRCSVSDRTMFTSDYEFTDPSKIFAINVDDKLNAEIIVHMSEMKTTDNLSAGALVERVTRSVTPDGESAIKIVAYTPSKFINLYITNNEVLDLAYEKAYTTYDADGNAVKNPSDAANAKANGILPIEPGDYIQFTANSQSIVTGIRLVWDYSKKATHYGSTNFNQPLTVYRGYAYSVAPEDSFVTIAIDGNNGVQGSRGEIATKQKYILFSWEPVVLFDTKTGVAKRIKMNEIIGYCDDRGNCDYLFMHQGYAQGKMIVIYR